MMLTVPLDVQRAARPAAASLAALCLLLDAVAGAHRWLAALAGLLFGLGLLVRIDALRDLALLVPVVAWLALRRHPAGGRSRSARSLGAAYGVVDALGPTEPYVQDLRALGQDGRRTSASR